MSKILRPILLIFSSFLLILQFFTIVEGQDIEATVTLDAVTPNIIRVEGKFLWREETRRGRNLSFFQDYAGISNLGERVSVVSLTTEKGLPVKFRRLMAGEYLADSDFVGWSYALDLTPFKSPTAAGHISWLTVDRGILFLDDVLPQTRGRSAATVFLKLPQNDKAVDPWADKENTFEYKDKESAVIYLCPNSRIKNIFSGKKNLTLSIAGDWKFSDEAASKMASDIFMRFEQLFGPFGSDHVNINIQPFPFPVAIGNYEADTRGKKITIISSDMPFKSQSLQRLHEQLRHEIFHLWIPNAVNLTGNYDWFYEGFALYQSLKLGVAVNRIRFDDYLDTLSRAHDVDAMLAQQISLIDASKNRWNGANTRIYARGMLVAFLCDLAMLDASKGKRSTNDLLREVYSKHGGQTTPQEGSAAILAIFKQHKELTPIVERYVTGAQKIEWGDLLKTAGIEQGVKDQVTRLAVTAKPSGRQKDLLDKLGYNSWRKLANGK